MFINVKMQIILQQIGAKSLLPSICDTIYTRAQGKLIFIYTTILFMQFLGNPLMCVEVAHYLLSSGVMVIGNDGECILTGDSVC